MTEAKVNRIKSLLLDACRGWSVLHREIHHGDAVHGLYGAYMTIENLNKACWLQCNEGDKLPITWSLIQMWENQIFGPVSSHLLDTGKELQSYQLRGRDAQYIELLYVYTSREHAINLFTAVSKIYSLLGSFLPYPGMSPY